MDISGDHRAAQVVAEKLPATKPDRMPRDAPPSCAEITTSLTWRDSVEVKTLTSSGITAPASVPQEMIVASFHHWVGSPPSEGIISAGNHEGECDGDERGDPDQPG